MKKVTKEIDVHFVSKNSSNSFKDGFYLYIDDKHIEIENIDIQQFYDCLKDSLSGKLIESDNLTIEKYSAKEIKMFNSLLYDKCMITLNGCDICNVKEPAFLYRIRGKNNYDFILICKKHLEKLVDYIDDMLKNGRLVLSSYSNFEIHFFEKEGKE